ncbi:MAG: purine-binding chemotaxis protein CheW [Methanobacteriota archaeon]|nr:MAG: purine-binding chemotaxis protein CheW [Euryarchaeota archaeon]
MTLGSESRQYIAFKLGNEEFAFEISSVKEIFPTQNVTKVHRSPEHIEGVMNLRGRLVTVIDLRKRFKLDAAEPSEKSRIIVIDSHEAPVGFIVDEVTEVTRLPADSIESVPAYVADGIESEYVTGIAKIENRLITLVDPLKILELSSEEPKVGGASSGNNTGR